MTEEQTMRSKMAQSAANIAFSNANAYSLVLYKGELDTLVSALEFTRDKTKFHLENGEIKPPYVENMIAGECGRLQDLIDSAFFMNRQELSRRGNLKEQKKCQKTKKQQPISF